MELTSSKVREQINAALELSDKSAYIDEFGRPIIPEWEKTIGDYRARVENEEYSEVELKAKSGEELTFKEKVSFPANT